jgi:hypothetical protein
VPSLFRTPRTSQARSRSRPRSFWLTFAVVTASLALAACGASATSQVRTKMMQFASAANAHDYTTICTQVLGPQLLADIAAGGLSCEKALSLGLGKVRAARLVVGTIKVSGASASVQTVTQAKGEQTAFATVVLEKVASGWRIKSLGDAAG